MLTSRKPELSLSSLNQIKSFSPEYSRDRLLLARIKNKWNRIKDLLPSESPTWREATHVLYSPASPLLDEMEETKAVIQVQDRLMIKILFTQLLHEGYRPQSIDYHCSEFTCVHYRRENLDSRWQWFDDSILERLLALAYSNKELVYAHHRKSQQLN